MVTPLTGLLLASFTITLGSIVTAVPVVADWLLPALTLIMDPDPAVMVTEPLVPVFADAEVAVIVPVAEFPV